MNTKKNTLLLAIATAGLVSLSACKSNQSQQQSSSMPSSGSPTSGGPSTPSSSSGSSGSSRPTVSSSPSIPGGPSSGLPSPGLPSPGGGLPSPGFPSAGTPGSSMPGTPGAETGQSGSRQSGQNGSESRDGFPNDESPFPAGDADGDGVPDTAQPGDSPYDDVDFSESSGGGSAASREERMASLDEELEGSMRDYDGRILEERAGVMGRANASGSEAQLEEFDRSVSYYDEVDDPGNETPPPPAGNPEATGEEPRGLPTSGRSQDIVTAPPDDIPSGDDDDVVARQIREAAMKERDPDLREALWEEYRKYKNQ